MDKNNLTKKLTNLQFHEVHIKSHKSRLKMALMLNAKKREEGSYSFNLHTMLFKKVTPIALLAVLGITLIVSMGNVIPPKTVSAREIVQQTIDDISTFQPKTEEEKEKWGTTLEALQNALNSQELTYLGEEKLENGITIKKLSFTDDDLSQEAIIRINEGTPELDRVSFDFIGNGDFLERSFEQIEVEMENGIVKNPEKLKEILKDRSITKGWIRKLIALSNKTCWDHQAESFKGKEEALGMTPSHQKFFDALKPFVESSEVLLADCGISWYYGSEQNGIPTAVGFNIHRIGNQKQKIADIHGRIDEAIKRLTALNSKTAQYKIKLLEMAKKATLHEQKWPGNSEKGIGPISSVSFTDETIGPGNIVITFYETSPDEQPDNIVTASYNFFDPFLTQGPDAEPMDTRKIIEIPIEKGELKNSEELKDDLLTNDPQKELIQQVFVQSQNKMMWNVYSQNVKDDAMRNIFEKILTTAEVSVYEMYYTKNENGEIDKIIVVSNSFGREKNSVSDPDKYRINKEKMLEEMLSKLSQDSNKDAQQKKEIIEKVMQSKNNLLYQGTYFMPNKEGKWHTPLVFVQGVDGEEVTTMKLYHSFGVTLDYEGRKLYVGLLYDSSDPTSASVEFNEGLFFTDNIIKTYTGKIANDTVTAEAILAELAPKKPLPEWMKFLIQKNNQNHGGDKIDPSHTCSEREKLQQKFIPVLEKTEALVNIVHCPDSKEQFEISYYAL